MTALTATCLVLAVATAVVLAGQPGVLPPLAGLALTLGSLAYAAHRYDTRRRESRVDRHGGVGADLCGCRGGAVVVVDPTGEGVAR